MKRLAQEAREQVSLAVPLCLAHVGNMLVGFVDTAMLGRYSQAALGGAGIAAGIIIALSMLGMGLVMALETLVPQAIGAGEHRRARALLGVGYKLAAASGVGLVALAFVSEPLFSLFGVEPGVREEAAAYLYWRIPGMIPLLLATSGRAYLQAYGLTRAIVIASVIANIVNVIANGALIFGDRGLVAVGLPEVGLPAFGAGGAGAASTFVMLASMVVIVYAAKRAAPPTSREAADDVTLARVAKIGWPVGLHLMIEVGAFAVMGMLAGRIGRVPVAAHNVALSCASISFAVALGLGASTSVRVGQAVGAGRKGARLAGITGNLIAAAVMATLGAVFLIAPQWVARLITNDPKVVAAAVPLLRIAALFQFSDATQAVMAGALRGAGDTKSTFAGNLFGHYAVGLPLAVFLAFTMDMGAAGLWWGLSAGLTSVAVILGARFWWITGRAIARV